LLFGSPVSIYGELRGRRATLSDDAFAALAFADGVIAHLWMSTTAAALAPRFRVLGSLAAYVKTGLDVQEADLRAGRTPADPHWGAEQPERWGTLGTLEDSVSIPTLPGCYQDFYGGVQRCIAAGSEPPVSLSDAVTTARVIDAVLRSARTGRAASFTP
jgi:predicted dehydrogenase